MKAAVVRTFGRPPEYGEFEEPRAEPGETLVSVTAASVSTLARSRAEGTHYSADASPPFVPGVDGVGTTPEGRRVYFLAPRPPFGSMAERSPVASDHLISLPDDLDDTTAAAAANAGMSCWVPLTTHAPIRPGESVLVNGATGVAGRMAIQVAKHLGARRVIATGRTESKFATLRDLGADVVLPLGQTVDALRDAVRKEAHDSRLGVVLDYLWGPSAETILAALGGPDAPRGPERVRYVQVGALAAPTITLASSLMRSSGVEILGSGIGASSQAELRTGIGEFLRAFTGAGFRISTEVRPLSDVEQAWTAGHEEKRLVFTVP